ncbi:Neuroendocrine convertase 1 [Trichoplax sp. H2]|nr:Neuroendocrine convertase 1 [Trichoplax sp. H2]|eukprot:RDD46375.1 Neuroendocrine convertase 1 [Trichoplax sp. H2]
MAQSKGNYSIAILLGLFFISITTAAVAAAINDQNDDIKDDDEGGISKRYSNTWIVKIPGGRKRADEVAHKLGYTNLGRISDLDLYNFRHDDVPRRSKRAIHDRTRRLAEDDNVEWVEQELIKYRYKRNADLEFNDYLWPKQWYLHDKRDARFDINVLPVWQKNITGKGVVVTILDDGLEHSHPDIKYSYDPEASYDYNDYDNDPEPRYDSRSSNRHGTRCAGEITMKPNNKMCGVGVAFGARIGGIRMLDGSITDGVEASSLGHNMQHVDIYSASWGPNDNGRTVDGPGDIVMKILRKGVTKGRGGLGSIYAWASGNGGRRGDNCNCDGYVNSIYTIAVSSASYNGTPPWYAEDCTPALASTYSSGADALKKVASIDLRGGCTTSHTGTSASAPMAAGIYALVLEANPNLTWRDVQHATVWTSNRKNLTKSGWARNGASRLYHHKFGFGILDAAALVDIVDPKVWKTVPEQKFCPLTADKIEREISSEGIVRIQIKSHGCQDSKDSINYLEHVQLISTIDFSRRGDLDITLISPSGTRSNLLSRRLRDSSASGFNSWPFMSTHFWGENPRGTWTVEIKNVGMTNEHGFVRETMLVFYGTETMPDVMRRVLSKDDVKLTSNHQSSQSHHGEVMKGKIHEEGHFGSNLNQAEHNSNINEHIFDKHEGNRYDHLEKNDVHPLHRSFHKKYSGDSDMPAHLLRYYAQILKRKNRNNYSKRSKLYRYQRDF